MIREVSEAVLGEIEPAPQSDPFRQADWGRLERVGALTQCNRPRPMLLIAQGRHLVVVLILLQSAISLEQSGFVFIPARVHVFHVVVI